MASRRAAEEMILAGRVVVNGKIVRELGTRVDPERDHVLADGRPVVPHRPRQYFAINKPRGYVSTASDPLGRPTVVDLVPHQGRLFPVGRLDWDTEGLLLLTDDGALAHRLTHPRFGVEKEYLVFVEGAPDDHDLDRLRTGIDLDGRLTAPATVTLDGVTPTGTWLRVAIHEGRQGQVRRMAEAIGHPVRRLRRVRIGGLELGGLARGTYRRLSATEVNRLKREAGEDEHGGTVRRGHRRPGGSGENHRR